MLLSSKVEVTTTVPPCAGEKDVVRRVHSLVDMQRDEGRWLLGVVDGRVPIRWMGAPRVPGGFKVMVVTGNAGVGDRVELWLLDPRQVDEGSVALFHYANVEEWNFASYINIFYDKGHGVGSDTEVGAEPLFDV